MMTFYIFNWTYFIYRYSACILFCNSIKLTRSINLNDVVFVVVIASLSKFNCWLYENTFACSSANTNLMFDDWWYCFPPILISHWHSEKTIDFASIWDQIAQLSPLSSLPSGQMVEVNSNFVGLKYCLVHHGSTSLSLSFSLPLP